MTVTEVHPDGDRDSGACPVVGCGFEGDDAHAVTDHLDDEHGLSDKILSGSVVIHDE